MTRGKKGSAAGKHGVWGGAQRSTREALQQPRRYYVSGAREVGKGHAMRSPRKLTADQATYFLKRARRAIKTNPTLKGAVCDPETIKAADFVINTSSREA